MPTPPPAAPSLAEQARQRFVEDTAGLMDRPEFRRWLWHLLDSPEWCRTHGLSAVAVQSGRLMVEPERVYFADGRRSIGVELSVFVQGLHRQAFLKMLNEQMGLRSQRPPPVNLDGE